jgi:redox-sensitive bicupin YhaK (pirin superfamily)
VTVHQDAEVYAGAIAGGMQLAHRLAPGRRTWIQVTAGRVRTDGAALAAGDGAALEQVAEIVITAQSDADLLVFDLA